VLPTVQQNFQQYNRYSTCSITSIIHGIELKELTKNGRNVLITIAMKPIKKPKSRQSVEAMVKKFFGETSGDVVSLTDAFKNWGRSVEGEGVEEENKQWLSNKLPHMKYYSLIEPGYAIRNNRRILDNLQLTDEGKRMMGKHNGGSSVIVEGSMPITQNINGRLSLDAFMKAVPQVRKDHPELEINVEVKVKSE